MVNAHAQNNQRPFTDTPSSRESCRHTSDRKFCLQKKAYPHREKITIKKLNFPIYEPMKFQELVQYHSYNYYYS